MSIVSLRRQTLHILNLNRATLPGTNRQSLELHSLALGLRLLSSRGVRLDTVDELVSGAGVVDVFETDVDALLQVSVADLLVDDDTDGRFCDVVDDASLAVVDFVGHTLLLRTVVLDVYDVADFVCFPVRKSVRFGWSSLRRRSVLLAVLHVRAELDHTLLSEVAREPVVVVSLFSFFLHWLFVETYA